MTVAWFSRALQTGSRRGLGLVRRRWPAVALLQLLVVRDGRAPLMVADEHGVRVRHGATWSGLRWQDIENVEVTSPSSWLRDGQIVVHPRVVSAEEALLAQAASTTTGVEDEGADGAVTPSAPRRRTSSRSPAPPGSSSTGSAATWSPTWTRSPAGGCRCWC